MLIGCVEYVEKETATSMITSKAISLDMSGLAFHTSLEGGEGRSADGGPFLHNTKGWEGMGVPAEGTSKSCSCLMLSKILPILSAKSGILQDRADSSASSIVLFETRGKARSLLQPGNCIMAFPGMLYKEL